RLIVGRYSKLGSCWAPQARRGQFQYKIIHRNFNVKVSQTNTKQRKDLKWTPCQGHFEKNYYLLSLLPPMLVPKEEWWQRKAHVQNLERVLLSSIIKMNYFRSLAALEFSVFQE